MMAFVSKRLTYANVAMTLALVFAMTGGAYAAKKYLISSTKQISPKVLKQLKGQPGPAGKDGTPGAQGVQGVQGPQGPAGSNGKDGTNGKSVVVSGTAAKCGAGGSTVEVEGSGLKHEICNGENGQTGFTETLPSGKTETGAWGFSTHDEGVVLTTISFNIPLENAPEAVHVIPPGEEGVVEPTNCPGTLEKPAAAPGQLCLYSVNLTDNIVATTLYTSGFTGVASASEKTGGVGDIDRGTWAVTAK